MRPRDNIRTASFAEAMDNPHSGQSYDAPTQLTQLSGAHENQPYRHFIFGHVITQMTANAGIRKHGNLAIKALMEEFAQLNDLSVFEPIDPRTMTHQQ